LDRYYPQIDGIRALAAVAVIGFHTQVFGLTTGFYGVDVFFVLSGYLTAKLAMNSSADFSTFMWRRFARLWPLLAFISMTYGVLYWRSEFPIWSEVFQSILFLRNIGSLMDQAGPLTPFWSVALEMQFYALSALLILWVKHRPTIIAILLFAFLTTTGMRVLISAPGDWNTAYFSPLTHSSGLFLGALLATLPIDRFKHIQLLFPVGTMLLIVAAANSGWGNPYSMIIWMSVVELGTACILCAVIRGASLTGFLSIKPLVVLGKWSYGVYLWHHPIALATREIMPSTWAFAFTLTASVILAGLTFNVIEKPARTWLTSAQKIKQLRRTRRYDSSAM
jgi:peptidoglycan/LPS O-acetylase OafA/YrhL